MIRSFSLANKDGLTCTRDNFDLALMRHFRQGKACNVPAKGTGLHMLELAKAHLQSRSQAALRGLASWDRSDATAELDQKC